MIQIPVDVFRRALPSLVQSAYAFLLPEIRYMPSWIEVKDPSWEEVIDPSSGRILDVTLFCRLSSLLFVSLFITNLNRFQLSFSPSHSLGNIFDYRGYTEPQLYYEACALWLNDGEDKENGEVKFVRAWKKIKGL